MKPRVFIKEDLYQKPKKATKRFGFSLRKRRNDSRRSAAVKDQKNHEA